MIAEFSVVPIGKGESLSGYVAECVRIVQASGLKYQLTPMATILEGSYDDIMRVVSACHKKVMTMSTRTVTSVKIDERIGATADEMRRKVESVERKINA